MRHQVWKDTKRAYYEALLTRSTSPDRRQRATRWLATHLAPPITVTTLKPYLPIVGPSGVVLWNGEIARQTGVQPSEVGR